MKKAALPPESLCENCGADEEDLVAVHRVYLEFDDGAVTGSTTLDETEQWCVPCRATYPNEPSIAPLAP